LIFHLVLHLAEQYGMLQMQPWSLSLISITHHSFVVFLLLNDIEDFVYRK